MDITCKKKSEALAHLNQFWSKFPFLSHYNSVGVYGHFFAAAAAAAVLQYCLKLFL